MALTFSITFYNPLHGPVRAKEGEPVSHNGVTVIPTRRLTVFDGLEKLSINGYGVQNRFDTVRSNPRISLRHVAEGFGVTNGIKLFKRQELWNHEKLVVAIETKHRSEQVRKPQKRSILRRWR